jgi:hypothetical protein
VRDLVKRLSSVALPAVTKLDLDRSRIGDEGLRLLGKVEAFPNLACVSLRQAGNTFTAKGAADFAKSPLGKQLKSLATGIAELDRLPPAPVVSTDDDDTTAPFRLL